MVFTLIFFQSYIIVAQNYKGFTTRKDIKLRGDMLLIGNNSLSFHKTYPYHDSGQNGYNSLVNVDIDNDNSTANSSSAKLTIPNPVCYKIVYAGLYWSAILQNSDRTDIDKVKLKLPTGGYKDIRGTIVYDANRSPINGNKPYACYADITSLVAAQADAQGNYTVANIKTSVGQNGGTGLSAGWSIFVIYEDPKLPTKFITTFDGFSSIDKNNNLNIPVSGFNTIPTGPVRAKFAFAALEGDGPIPGDYFKINGYTISAANASNRILRPSNNFFNSSVTYINPTTGKTENFLDRSPASTNTLGYDAGILNIDNPSNRVIANNATSVTLRLGSVQDLYFYYFNAISVDIIAPVIVLTKLVKNAAGQDIGGKPVKLGQQLNYEIGFRNTGNDDATSFTIKDKLPDNIIFNYPGDLLTLPTGVTVKNYDAAKREIIFDVSNSLIKANSLKETIIKFKVQVVPDCTKFTNACSNSIDNSAYATYRGVINNMLISDDPSVNSNTGCVLIPQATNFLADTDTCKYDQNVTLCGTNIDLTASGGYTSYTWYSDAALTKKIGTGQTLNVKNTGTYFVYNLAAAPCKSIMQSFVVTRPGNIVNNPVEPYQDDYVVCPNDGKKLPHILLCGANAYRDIKTNISGTTSIVWEKLDEASCTATSNPDCANESPSCTWKQEGSGADFRAKKAGQYRLKLNFIGGCESIYYFNVYTNLLNPTETHKDIICTTLGNITIGGVSGAYEYSIDGINFQSGNSFDITNPGIYTAYIRQQNAPANSCVFTIPDIQISQRNFNVVDKVITPLCYGDKGAIEVAVNDANAQYYFKLYDDAGKLLSAVGPVIQSDYTFKNLDTDKDYTLETVTDDGCKDSRVIHVSSYSGKPLTVSAALIEPLTPCSNAGKIKITATGGDAPYNYSIDGGVTFQNSDEIDITTPGVYDIEVVDNNNCSVRTSITVTDNPKPIYTVTNTDNICYSSNSAEIKVNVTNANGYTMSYSIDKGVTFQNNPVFPNLAAGTYDVVVRYTIAYTPVPGQPALEKYCEDTTQVVITGPTSAVTASGGVAALAGCTISGQGGKLRINNVQGGTAPYQYSFDGGISWQAKNEKDVMPGHYILKVKDFLGCEYTIPYTVILDAKPADPTITIDSPVFNCNGTATTVVKVTNNSSANFTYEYYLDGVANTPITSDTFINVPSGNHKITVKYKVTNVPSYSNLLMEDFGRGVDTTTPGIHAAYCWEKQDNVADCGIGGFMPVLLNDGEYVVTKGLLPAHANNFRWNLPKDNTAVINNTPQIQDGRFLAVNVGGIVPAGGVLYRKTINDVIPNQDIQVSVYMLNLLDKTNNFPSPSLTIELQKNGVVIPGASKNTPLIPRDEKWHNSTNLGNGQVLTLNPGNNTSLDFVILSQSQVIDGNDLAIDDIWVRQIPQSCLSAIDFPFDVPSDKAFKAEVTGFKNVSCFGKNDGELTISAENFKLPYGFDYTLDNVTWVNSKVSPVTVKGLSAKSYNIQVRFDASASGCVQSLTHVITSPAVLTVAASVTKVATCIEGATITASAAGGTPAYEFELRDAAGVTVIVPFQSSGVFSKVNSGVYTVFTRDQNSCSSSASAQITVSAPVLLAAALSNSSNLCYTPATPATLEVTATGTAPYTYSLNGAPAQSSNIFTNVGPGTHTILVTDNNGCTATISNIVIAPQIQGSAVISKTLDCTISSPDAVIKVDIAGGTAPFTYKVKKGAGSYGSSIPVIGASFDYKATTADTYTFQITDVNNCITVVTTTIDAPVNPIVSATKIDALCNGSATGSVQLTGALGSGGYTYLFYESTTPIPANFTAQSNYTGLAAGTYNYQVKDSKDCTSALGSITIDEPTALVASATATAFKCDPSNVKQAATVTIAVPTTGTAPYQYSFDGGAFTPTRTLT
ncbi:hypothetical protein B4N84_27360, partial [Flavobacterium sp. IR1]